MIETLTPGEEGQAENLKGKVLGKKGTTKKKSNPYSGMSKRYLHSLETLERIRNAPNTTPVPAKKGTGNQILTCKSSLALH